jgi:hypothetical protein
MLTGDPKMVDSGAAGAVPLRGMYSLALAECRPDTKCISCSPLHQVAPYYLVIVGPWVGQGQELPRAQALQGRAFQIPPLDDQDMLGFSAIVLTISDKSCRVFSKSAWAFQAPVLNGYTGLHKIHPRTAVRSELHCQWCHDATALPL